MLIGIPSTDPEQQPPEKRNIQCGDITSYGIHTKEGDMRRDRRKRTAALTLLTALMILVMSMTVFAAPKISKKSVKMNIGQSVTLKVSGTKSKVTWKSSNKKVVTVSGKGVITAKGAGKAAITAKAGSKKLTCKVTVTVKSLKLSVAKLTISPKRSYKVIAVADGHPVSVKWKTSNKKIATVSSKGVISTKKTGSVTITASYGGKTAKLTVKVKKNAATKVEGGFNQNASSTGSSSSSTAPSVTVTVPTSQTPSASTPSATTPAVPSSSGNSSTPSSSGSSGSTSGSGTAISGGGSSGNSNSGNNSGSSGSGSNANNNGGSSSGSATEIPEGAFTDEQFSAYLEKLKTSSEIPDYSKLTDLQKRKAYDLILARKCGFFTPGITNWQRIENLTNWMQDHIPYSEVGSYYSRYTRDDSIAPGYDLAELLKERYPNDYEFTNIGYDCIWAAQMVVDYAHYFRGLEATRYLAPMGTSGTHQNAAVYLPAEGGRPEGWYSCIPGYSNNRFGQHMSNTPFSSESAGWSWYDNLMRAIAKNPTDRYLGLDYDWNGWGYDYEKGLTK